MFHGPRKMRSKSNMCSCNLAMNFGRVKSLSLWLSSHFESDRATSHHFNFTRVRPLVLPQRSSWNGSSNPLITLCGSDSFSCKVLILIIKKVLRRDLDKKAFYRYLAGEASFRDLVQRPLREILYRDQRDCTEILPRDLAKKILWTDLLKSLTEILPGNVSGRELL